MRIISKFHDYYDSAMGYGQDDGLVYIRDAKDLSGLLARKTRPGEDGPSALAQLAPSHYPTSELVTRVSVYFCGKVHRGLALRSATHTVTQFVAWTSLQLDAWLQKLPPRQKDLLSAALDKQSLSFLSAKGARRVRDWISAAPASAALDDIAIKHRAPILLCAPASATLTANACLSDVDFYRAVAAPQAFQEIAMWLGSRLTDASQPPLAITDKVRLQQHGFDRYSFRRAPGA